MNVVATALRQLWRDHKFGTKDVVIGVGNQRVLIRDLDLPAMPLDQIRASLQYQVQDLLPVAVEDAVLDYLPTGSTTVSTAPSSAVCSSRRRRTRFRRTPQQSRPQGFVRSWST